MQRASPVLALCAASFALNLAGGSFPATFHPDEARLVRMVGGAPSDGNDPALAAHLGRLSISLVGDGTPHRIAAVGRWLSALFGSLSVLLVWRLAREVLPARYALFGAAIGAVSPLLIVHAHYFTPDTLALALGLTAILCLSRTLERADPIWIVGLGASMGLAVSAHYGGTLLVLVCLVAPAVVRTRDVRAYGRRIGRAAGIAVAVFAVTNVSLLAHPERWAGPWLQLQRLLGGDHLYVSGPAYGFSFHLVRSLVPGFTVPVLLPAALGIVTAIGRRKRLPPTAGLVFLYGGLAWTIAELSPLKPDPGFLRYILPTVPAVALAVGLALQALHERLRASSLRWVPAVVVVAVAAYPAARSIQIVDALGDDTRLRADAWIEANAGRTLREPHSSAHPHDVASLAVVDLDAARRSGVTHLATSSFVYATFARGSRLARQREYVYERHERYQELFEYPYQEFTSNGPSLGWSNPTIRVLDIRLPRPPGRP